MPGRSSAGSLPVLVLISVASGAVAPFLGVTLQTHLSQFPPAARRRLMSVDFTVIRAAGTASMLVVPAAAAASPAAGFWAGGVATVTVSLVGAAAAWRYARQPTPAVEKTAVLAHD